MTMKVLHISTYDYEGAATATYRLHENLITHGIESKIIVSQKTKNDDKIVEIKRSTQNEKKISLQNKLDGKLKKYKNKYNFIDKQQYVDISLETIIQKLGDFSPNIIVLHWISNFLSLETIYELQKHYNAKVFWFQMDMAPMTGGCHFAWECEGYKTNCYPCPAVRWLGGKKQSNYLLYKKKYVDLMKITPIVGGSFVKHQVESSFVFKNQNCKKVIIGIDDDAFKPIDNTNLKNQFGLGQTNKRIVFFSLYDIKNERKGFKYLLDALILLDKSYPNFKDNILLLTAGHIENDILADKTNFEINHIGYLDTQEKLANAYQLADIFISASVEDSGPMMVMESILSGVPVVAFDLGIAQDIVIDNQTGYVAELKNSEDLARKIHKIASLSDEDLKQIKINCRELGLRELTYEKQFEDFMEAIGEVE
jgi:glycosyltransferase involved in cell wall biosynthesis